VSTDTVVLVSGGVGQQYLCTAPNTWTAAGSSFPVTSAQTVSTGGSLSPTGLGQIASNQLWLPAGIPAPAVAASNTGSIGGNPAYVGITWNTALGETMLGTVAYSTAITGSCTGGTCAYTITAPTLPSGVTGYTAYECETGAALPGTGIPPCTLKKVAGCANIVTNCAITTSGAGANAPTVNTAWLQPPNIQATECPSSIIPSMFLPDNSGNYRTMGGVEPNSNNGQTSGTWEICHRTWFNDTLTVPPGGNNAFVLIDHQAATGTSNTNQDRSLWVGGGTPSGFSGSLYAAEAIQSELGFNCTACTITGSPDGEITDISGNTTETATAHYTAPNGYGVNVYRGSLFKQGAGSSTNYNILNGQFQSNNSTYTGGDTINGVKFGCAGVMTNAWCWGFNHFYNTSATNWQAALITHNTPSGGATQNSVMVIDNTIPGINSLLNGPTYESQVNNNNVGAFLFSGAINLTGGQQILQNSIAGPTGVSCTGGASTYQYKLVGVDANGGTVTSAASQCSTGTNPLAGGTPATISVNFTMAQAVSFLRIDVYRISGPMTTGKIGSLSCSASTAIISNPCSNFVDTGIAADGGTIPTPNTTGTSFAAGYVSNSANKAFVAANFTTAANTNLQTITGLTFNLLPAALNYQFHCALSYSQATANAAVAFGIQAATVNPTNIFATGGIGTSATAGTTGVLATLASTTATSIVSATPSATATNFTAVLDGTIEEPANDAGQVINIMVSTANSGDAVTVLRGSYCYLY
jgi:hypothetical protein